MRLRFKTIYSFLIFALFNTSFSTSKEEIQKRIKHFEMVRDSANFTIEQLKKQLQDSS